MAHNYDRHFGRIRNLRSGDRVTFTDMEGTTVEYEVVAHEILEPMAVEEMTAGAKAPALFVLYDKLHKNIRRKNSTLLVRKENLRKYTKTGCCSGWRNL